MKAINYHKSKEEGKAFIPILILIVLAAVVAVLFLSKGSVTSVAPVSSAQPVAPVVQKAKGQVALMLTPSEATTAANQTFTLSVSVDSKTDSLSATDLVLKYDTNYLEATVVKSGAFLPVTLSQGKIGAGSAEIVVGANPTSPQKGVGTIATVTFKAKKAGKTQIMVDNSATQVAAIGKTGSVLGSSLGTIITIK